MEIVNRIRNWLNLRELINFTSGNIVFQIATTIAELAILNWIPVNSVGIWQLGLLLQSYFLFSRLGILNAFNREYPFSLSSKKVEKSSMILQVTYFHTLLGSGFQFLCFVVFGLFSLISNADIMIVIMAFSLSFYTIIEAQISFYESKWRSELLFRRITYLRRINLILILLTLIFPYYYGFYGLIIRILIIQVVLFLFTKRIDKDKIKLTFNLLYWKFLFNEGWKFWIWSFSKSFIRNLPRQYLLSFSNFVVVGLFTPINWILSSFSLLLSNITIYLYPILTRKFAEKDQNIFKNTLIINLVIFILFVPIVIITYLLLPSLVAIFLPKFVSVVSSMRVILISCLFDVFTINSTIWASQKDWKVISFLTFINAFLYLIGLIYVHFLNGDLIFNISILIVVISVITSLLQLSIIIGKIYFNPSKSLLIVG
jgi:O-antigen/teichoic acid export membrane protein